MVGEVLNKLGMPLIITSANGREFIALPKNTINVPCDETFIPETDSIFMVYVPVDQMRGRK